MGTHPSDYEDKSSTHPSDYEDKSSTHPSDRNLYSQFIIDLPRLTLYLNEKLCNDSSEQVYDYLYDRLNKRQLRFCLYFLTQTSLADYYFKEYKKLKDNHLVIRPQKKNKQCRLASESMLPFAFDRCRPTKAKTTRHLSSPKL